MIVRLPHLRRFVIRIPRRRRPLSVDTVICIAVVCLLAIVLAVASAMYLVDRIAANLGMGPYETKR